jgi:hypothetical protein
LRSNRSHHWAALIVVTLSALLFWGLKNDIGVISPSFGFYCEQVYDEIWAQAPTPDAPPPPGKSGQEDGGGSDDTPGVAPAGPFGLDELSSRVGFNHTLPVDPATWAQRLGAGWYIDWYVQPRSPTQKPEHWQMIQLARGCVSPNEVDIRWLASRYRGSVWIIGNEPDNIWQDNLTPEAYARTYHDLYYLIKDADPMAAVAVGGVTQGTPLRLAYLDRVLNAYEGRYGESMPVDWWTVHGFVLREERGNWGAEIPPGFALTNHGELYEIDDTGSVVYFKVHVIDFRTWMAARGYRDTPLAVTEFGILLPDGYGFTPAFVASYLLETFTWLDRASDDKIGYPQDDYRLVQRWAWFSLYDKLYYTSNLAHVEADALTDIGLAFQKFVEERSP